MIRRTNVDQALELNSGLTEQRRAQLRAYGYNPVQIEPTSDETEAFNSDVSLTPNVVASVTVNSIAEDHDDLSVADEDKLWTPRDDEEVIERSKSNRFRNIFRPPLLWAGVKFERSKERFNNNKRYQVAGYLGLVALAAGAAIGIEVGSSHHEVLSMLTTHHLPKNSVHPANLDPLISGAGKNTHGAGTMLSEVNNHATNVNQAKVGTHAHYPLHNHEPATESKGKNISTAGAVAKKAVTHILKTLTKIRLASGSNPWRVSETALHIPLSTHLTAHQIHEIWNYDRHMLSLSHIPLPDADKLKAGTELTLVQS